MKSSVYTRLWKLVILSAFLSSFVFAQPRDLKSVEGKNGLVSTAHPLASQAALKILQKGGNAVDAAVAAAFTIGVVEPDGSGLGGGGCMLVYSAEKGKSYNVNYYQHASEKVNEIEYKRNEGINAKTALVPGTVAGLTKTLEEFGTMSLKEVMQDAINYAENGFPIDNTLATIILDNISILEKYEQTKNVFMPDGFPLVEGDILKQPELANTLKLIAEKGAKGFYEGTVAEKISNGFLAEGGRMTLDDLKNFQAEINEPVYGNYKGYEIVSASPPQGGVSLIETMNMMEHINFDSLGYFTNSVQTLHLMSEVFLRSYADRYFYVGDPHFSDIMVPGLTSKKYAALRFADIDWQKTAPEGYRKTKSLSPEEFNTQSLLFDDKGNPDRELIGMKVNDNEKAGHTTHISVVDKNGNMVSLTQTLGTFFGCGYSAAGVVFNSSFINFSSGVEVNKLKPGKIPRSTISPTFMLKDGKPFLCLGSPGGGRIISTLAEIIVNIVDFGMTAESANQAPRFHCQVNDDYLYLEGRFAPEIVEKLNGMGHSTKVYNDYDLFFGGAQFIIIDPETKIISGTADRRRGGVALGY